MTFSITTILQHYMICFHCTFAGQLWNKCLTDLLSLLFNHVTSGWLKVLKSVTVMVCKHLDAWNKMQVMLHKLTESTCGWCGTLSATVHRGFHAEQRGDRVPVVGSPHRPALSQPAACRAPCVRPGLGEKGYIIGPWPLPLPCSSQLFHHKKMEAMEFYFFNFTPKLFPHLITHLDILAEALEELNTRSRPETLSAAPSTSIRRPNTVINQFRAGTLI